MAFCPDWLHFCELGLQLQFSTSFLISILWYDQPSRKYNMIKLSGFKTFFTQAIKITVTFEVLED